MRKWNFVAAVLAGALVLSTTSFALSLQDRLSAWADAPEDERLVVARALTVVASQGLPTLNEDFFQSCLTSQVRNRSYRRKGLARSVLSALPCTFASQIAICGRKWVACGSEGTALPKERA
jgi:hypothetical protein